MQKMLECISERYVNVIENIKHLQYQDFENAVIAFSVCNNYFKIQNTRIKMFLVNCLNHS